MKPFTGNLWLVMGLFFSFSLPIIGCGDDDSEAPPAEESVLEESESSFFVGRWVRESKAGTEEYTFESTGRFLKRTYEVGGDEASTCSQGLYEADQGVLNLYGRGGNGGWKKDVQPYAIDGSTLSFTEVYLRDADASGSEEGAQTWSSFEHTFQIIAEIAQENPCEIEGVQSTPESLCCTAALEGISIPSGSEDWPMLTQVEATIVLFSEGASSFEWAKMDSKGNIYVDPKGGETEVSETGTWSLEDDGRLFVSDDQAVRAYISLTSDLMYEQNNSWLFERQ